MFLLLLLGMVFVLKWKASMLYIFLSPEARSPKEIQLAYTQKEVVTGIVEGSFLFTKPQDKGHF